ncbi:MAG: hypothetical protein P3B76_13970 [Gemmatimonadota bacterium]|nr:hypothetical protein [Gemmatimonadota bacterium]MDQ8173783.1 hypothetical protein [Gemmatimonadota bacterium]
MPAPTSVIRSTAPSALRRALTIAALTVVGGAAPALLQAQVGSLPANSPYEDVKLGQNLSIMGGWMLMTRDPANVAPKSSATAALRYDVAIGGPASLYVRYLLAPSERALLLPTNPKATRQIDAKGTTTHLLDAGLDLALTGKKTWHRLIPSVTGGAGVVTDFAAVDTGSYKFGTKFSFSYGLGVRYLPRKGPMIRVDLTNFVWQYDYPDRYFVKAADTTSVLTDTRNRSAWRGSRTLTVGLTLPLFR